MRPRLTESELVLFEQNYSRVLKAVMMFCNNKYLAEDATQDAFLIAFKKLRQLRDKKKFSAWVYTIAINVIRKNKSHEKTAIDFDTQKNYLYSCLNTDEIDLKEDLKNILWQLNEDYRRAVILYYEFDLSIDEISSITEIKSGTLKSHLYRARNKLKLLLQENGLLDWSAGNE